MLALMVSMLMSEVDMLKSEIENLNGGKIMNEMFLNMYVIAVETGRLTIDFIPMMYKREVARNTWYRVLVKTDKDKNVQHILVLIS